RKVYWEEQQKYYCIGIIERIIDEKHRISNFYSFDREDPLRKYVLPYIPSFYVMSILPEYYENLINDTLKLFNKTSVFSNIRTIKLSYQEKKVLYLEEYVVEEGIKKSYGVILIPEVLNIEEGKNLSFFKRNLRSVLDAHKELRDVLFIINENFVFESWPTESEEDLDNIKKCFDC
ncbi:MAG: hypothetical protein ACFFHV_11265, partial [Promethearchaeota archaeon]